MCTGCGVNINNQHPTMSVNDAISLYNKETGHNLPPLSIEGVLASTFNCFEGLLSVYEVQGLEGILKLYYNYWLHRYRAKLGEGWVKKVVSKKDGVYIVPLVMEISLVYTRAVLVTSE